VRVVMKVVKRANLETSVFSALKVLFLVVKHA
jgi:hypothetical protein